MEEIRFSARKIWNALIDVLKDGGMLMLASAVADCDVKSDNGNLILVAKNDVSDGVLNSKTNMQLLEKAFYSLSGTKDKKILIEKEEKKEEDDTPKMLKDMFGNRINL